MNLACYSQCLNDTQFLQNNCIWQALFHMRNQEHR
uniref:Uncharacterized protein n=1 Tax=Anguilla anguilla TaxID=7936 RepID=A0A0E9VS78_ANGAN